MKAIVVHAQSCAQSAGLKKNYFNYNQEVAMETRYREIEVRGTPFEMGRQIGEAAREEIDSLGERGIPAVTVIPSVAGNRGVAMQLIRHSVRRAMGAEFI